MKNIQLAALELTRNQLIALIGKYVQHYVNLEARAAFDGDADLAEHYGLRVDNLVYVGDMIYSSPEYYATFLDIAEALAARTANALPTYAVTYQQPLFIAA